MPRTKPTTSWSERTWVITSWVSWRVKSFITWDASNFTWNETNYTWDTSYSWITTDWDASRYDTYIENINWINVFDINENQVLWISGIATNKIDTVWS